MSSDAADARFTDVLLRPEFVLGVVLVVAFAYAVIVVQQPLRYLWLVASLGVTTFVLWLLYRLVVAVEELSATVRRIESSMDEDRGSAPDGDADATPGGE